MTTLDKESFSKMISESIAGESRLTKTAELFLQKNPARKRYAIGLNDETWALHNTIGIDGVIFDGQLNESNQWRGVPVVKSSDLPANSLVANCSTSISPVNVESHLRSVGFEYIANIGDIIYASNNNKLPWPWFVQEQRQSCETFSTDWWNLYSSFVDDESRQHLLNILKFRLTADPRSMTSYKVRLNDQYFEDFMQFRGEIFVDAGGFDGDTTEEFCKRYPDYNEVLFFEPSAKNMSAAKKRLQNLRNIEYFELGLSDGQGTLQFDSESGSASSISSEGNEQIQVDALDNATEKPVSFIKMDLEGWELAALKGSERTITKHRPKLAISVYHSAKDFIEVPRYLLSIHPDYKVRLRHYTQGWSETVMFFS